MPGTGSRRAVTMASVAQLAGVSVTTVSHVVNKTRRVSPDKERLVLAAIADTGYVPDVVTRSLRSAGSQTIGLAMSAISNVYFADVVQGIERAVSRAGYSLLIVDTHDDLTYELRAVSDLLARQVEAIIMAPSADASGALKHARLRKVPVVLIDRLTNDDLDQIGAEGVEATAGLVDHLAGLGHERIVMMSGLPGLSTTADRVNGFKLGLRRNGLPESPDSVVVGDSNDDKAEKVLHTLINRKVSPTALVVGNNAMTIGVLRAARNMGVQIPKDLALVSYDDFSWADLFHPRLTTIAQPLRAMGEQAVELVLSRLGDPTRPARKVVLRPSFMHRESCGCPPEATVR